MTKPTSRAHHPYYDDPRWKVMWQQQLAVEPYCRFCLLLGRHTRATIVDHVKAHRGSATLFFSMRNLQSLCVVCHNSIKAQIERAKRNAGCGLDGRPRSRSHHWNQRRGVSP